MAGSQLGAQGAQQKKRGSETAVEEMIWARLFRHRRGRKQLSPHPHFPLNSPPLPIAIWLLPQHGTALIEVTGDLFVVNPMDVSQHSF